MSAPTHPPITLYTNRACPYAQRAHFALAELNLPYEEVSIDLTKPREPWYLAINPRGLVPALKYGDDILIESNIITQFLADLAPSHLLPASGNPAAALIRARIAIFVDLFSSKVSGPLMAGHLRDEQSTQAPAIAAAVKNDIAPLLKDAAPFFGGSKTPTLAEVNTGSFLLRLYALGKRGEWGGLLGELEAVEEWRRWKDAVLGLGSLTGTWNEEESLAAFDRKKERLRQEAQAGK